MKRFTDTRIKKANNVVSKAADMLVDFYNEELEKSHKIFTLRYLYLLKGISYMQYPNVYSAKILDKVLDKIPSIPNLENNYSRKSDDFDIVGNIYLDSKNRFVVKVTSIPFRKIVKSLPQCKEGDKGVFVIQNSLNFIKYLYIYIFLQKITINSKVEVAIRKLFIQAKNKEVIKLSLYKKIRKANYIKSNPIKKIQYPCNIPLFYHQRKGIQMGIIMDQYGYVLEQRTGKTLVNACIAAMRYELGQVNKVLIVGPISCFKAWRDTFNNEIKVVSTFYEFKDGIGFVEGLDISILNFESLNANINNIKKSPPDMVILDESHRISDKTSNQSKAAHKLSFVKYKYINTGTPTEGDKLQDMWSPYRFLMPELLGNTYTEFSDKYLELGEYRNVIGYKKKEELLRKIHNTSYVLSYEECFGDKDIPSIDEYGSLGEVSREIYKGMNEDSFIGVGNAEIEAKIVLSKMIKLHQIAGGHIIDEEGNIIELSKDKLILLYQVLIDRKLLKKKTVIYARFTHEIWAINNYLIDKGIKTLVLTGKDISGRVTTKEFREKLIHKFTVIKKFTHIIIQIKIAKESLDLSVADNEIFYSNGFSFKDYDQAKKRIRNANKNSQLNCINLLMEDTIDTDIQECMVSKKDFTADYFYDNKDFKQ